MEKRPIHSSVVGNDDMAVDDWRQTAVKDSWYSEKEGKKLSEQCIKAPVKSLKLSEQQTKQTCISESETENKFFREKVLCEHEMGCEP